jgi:hypothetical protein
MFTCACFCLFSCCGLLISVPFCYCEKQTQQKTRFEIENFRRSTGIKLGIFEYYEGVMINRLSIKKVDCSIRTIATNPKGKGKAIPLTGRGGP